MTEDVAEEATQNDNVAPPPPTGPQIQRREKWVDLPEQEYPGFKVQVWVNAPSKLWPMLSSGEEAEAQAAAKQLVIAHNGWLDFEGQPFPPPSETSFWEEIPTELAACILAGIQAEMQKLPNSMAPRRRRSKRG